MSLATDLAFYKTHPVPLAEIDEYEMPVFMINVAPFTWFLSRDNLYAWVDSAFDGADRTNPAATLVSTVRTSEGFLTKANSYSQCEATAGTFYWGAGTVDGGTVYGLWVRRYDGNNPMLYTMLYGITSGFRKGGTREYINDVEYEDKIISIPGIKRVKGSYYSGKSINEGGPVELKNADGELDALIKAKKVFGNAARVKLGLDHYVAESFVPTFTGYLRLAEDGSRKTVKLTFKQRDDKLKVGIPPNRFDQSAYPYLNDSNVGKVKPLVYGERLDLPVICLNETETTPTYYNFLVADMADHVSLNAINAAYKYVDGVKTALAIASSSLTAGTFSVLAADYTPGQTVTADVEGYQDGSSVYIEKALAQIKDLIVTYGHAQDNDAFFNPAYWDDASSLNFATGFDVSKETNISKQIEEITKRGTLAHFQTDDDGRYSCRIFDDTAATDLVLNDYEIRKVENIEDSADEELVAVLVVNYAEQVQSKAWSVVTNTDYQQDNDILYENFNQPDPMETVISGQADAAVFAAEFQAQYGVPRTIVTITTGLQCFDQRICNIIQVPLHRPKCQERGDWRGELIGLEVDFNAMECRLTLRLFEEVTT